MTRTPRILASVAGAAALLAGPAVAATTDSVPKPTKKAAYTAKVVVPTKARTAPGAGKTLAKLKTSAPIYGGTNSLLVLDSKTVNGTMYLKVRLPQRPNETSGWVSADDVVVSKTPYRIVIDISSRTVTLFKAGKKAGKTKAVVGSSRTPTPTGLFALSEKVPQPAGNKLGSYVLALAAHSNVHKTFAGGDGTVGIHGYERLGNPLGSAASNGCIRIPERFLRKLVANVPPGAPVVVTN